MITNKSIIEKAIAGEDPGFFAGLILTPLSSLYSIAVWLRLLLYRYNILRSKKVPCKVISVGNITVGGSGKTPMTLFLANKLKANGFSVSILSRGYGRSNSKNSLLISDGKELLADLHLAGDEPYLMANSISDVPVAVASKRIDGAQLLIDRFDPDVIILDDGFQHLSLQRDIDIVLIDDRVTKQARLLPHGPLREPLSALNRAQLILSRGATQSNFNNIAAQFFNFNYKVTSATELSSKKSFPISSMNGKKIFAFSALARNDSFLKTLSDLGLTVSASLFFPDHHWYRDEDIDRIEELSKDCELIVTTEKDAVKITKIKKQLRNAFSINISVEINNEEDFMELLSTKLKN